VDLNLLSSRQLGTNSMVEETFGGYNGATGAFLSSLQRRLQRHMSERGNTILWVERYTIAMDRCPLVRCHPLAADPQAPTSIAV
jgi:hypothetical protein